MPLGNLEDFQNAVKNLWSTYKSDVGPMWEAVIKKYPTDSVQAALMEHRKQNPDATKPNWKMIYGALGGKSSSQGSDLYHLLNLLRRNMLTCGWTQKQVDGLDDYAVFQNHLDARVKNILFKPLSDEPKEDPTGSLAGRAKLVRQGVAYHLIQDLKQREEQVPEYLLI